MCILASGGLRGIWVVWCFSVWCFVVCDWFGGLGLGLVAFVVWVVVRLLLYLVVSVVVIVNMSFWA